MLALVENVAIACLLLPDVQTISNAQNIYYERINWEWAWVSGLGSIVSIIIVLPVFTWPKNRLQRWLALVLLPLPLCAGLAEWFQLLLSAASHGIKAH